MLMNHIEWEDIIARMSEYRHNVWHWEEYCFCFYTTIYELMAHHNHNVIAFHEHKASLIVHLYSL